MKLFHSLLVLTSIALLASCNKAVPTQQINTERIKESLTVLTADSLQGRKAGTEGARMAADYIAGRFREAGLEKFPGTKNYRQKFSIDESVIGKASLEINSEEIDEGDYWCYPAVKTINWKDLTEVRTITVSDESELRANIYEYINDPEPLVVLLSTELAPWIGNLKRYFPTYKRPSWENDTANPPAPVLMVVIDEIKEGSFTAKVETSSTDMQNVVGMIKGATHPEEYVVFSAHYDHIGILSAEDGDSIANGADDDASGTTAVMELASHFSATTPERTLLFVAFTAEEIGGYGSQFFSRQLNPDEVVAMFNIEMIGKPSKFGPNTAFITGFELTDFGKILQKESEGTGFRFHPDPYPEQNLFYRSDNATLARLGVPAHTISTDQIDSDPYYHTVNDEMSTLNLDHMQATIEAIAQSAGAIIRAEASPSRVPVDAEVEN